MEENKPAVRYTFSKEEKLCYQKSIDRLFAQGASFISYPLRVVYILDEELEQEKQIAKVLISVPKRKFKRANKRNRIKRLIREVYRLNKHPLIELLQEQNQRLDIAFLYLKDELPTIEEIEKAFQKVLLNLGEKIVIVKKSE